ncbi:9886_t:CDS:2, partial [Racocetra fulgida]
DPVIKGYLVAILEPRFKNLKFALEKFKEKKFLKQKIKILLDKDKYLNNQPIAKQTSNLASLFNSITNIVYQPYLIDRVEILESNR